MRDYFYDVETVRLAIVLGVVVSMLFYERIQLTSGGAIVPAYLALFLPSPPFVLFTLAAGCATYYVVSVQLARRRILYGRRKFEVEVLVGMTFIATGTLLGSFMSRWEPAFVALAGVGFVTPGVLAHDMFRQRPRRTILAVLANTAIVALLVYVFHSLFLIASWGREPAVLLLENSVLGYPVQLLLVGVITSVLIGVAVFARLGLRSGGFVSAAYLGLMLLRPADLAYTLVVAGATYLVVARLLMPRLLIFGRRKLATMVLVGAVLGWALELALTVATGGAWVPWRGFGVITLMVPALLANDAQRQGVERTLWGAAIGATGVFGVVNLVDALRRVVLAAAAG